MSKSEANQESDGPEVKFAADRMLGRLVKWLRVIGCDVIYGQHLTGHGLIRAAWAEERLILTRDRRLKHKQPPRYILIASDRYQDQLRQVLQECGIKIGNRLFSRCLACNSALQTRPKETVKNLVPAYVYTTQESFSWCAACQRVYWPATHQQKMLTQLRKLSLT